MIYSKEEKEFIVENYGRLSVKEIGTFLNRKASAVVAQAARLGLKNRYFFEYNRTFDFFKELKNPRFIYFLGFSWADGYLAKETGKFSFTLEINEKDGKEIVDILNSFDKNLVKFYTKKHGSKVVQIRNRNTELTAWLAFFDYRDKSHVEPSKILGAIDKSFHYLFWRGFFDGDGCIERQKSMRRITFTANFNYRWTCLCSYLKNLNIKFYISRRHKDGVGGQSTVVFWRKNDVMKFYKEIYPDGFDFGLRRKYDRFDLPHPNELVFLNRREGNYDKSKRNEYAVRNDKGHIHICQYSESFDSGSSK